MANLYALIVGINGYQQKPLEGCVHDAQAVKDYLTASYQGSDLHITILTDDDGLPPTRENIIAAFSIFDSAGNDDQCLFYYSGHGSFTLAPAAFQSASGYLRSFVCLDSRLPDGRDLMDKEMSYLIWKATLGKPEMRFTAITDCCHSGTITKSFLDDNGVTDKMIPVSPAESKVAPEDFLGYASDIGTEKAYEWYEENGERFLRVKQGRHIHIASSRNHQTSKELMIEGFKQGAFTHALLKTLRKYQNGISYAGLVEQAGVQVRNLVNEQEPGLNLNGGLPAGFKNSNFLSDHLTQTAEQYLVYSDKRYGWCAKCGPLHDVMKGDTLQIAGIGDFQIITTASADLSVIAADLRLGSGESTFYATVIRQTDRAVSISLAPDTDPAMSEHLADAARFGFRLADGQGQYIIRSVSADETSLTMPGSEKALFKPIKADSAQSAELFLKQAEKVVKWRRLLSFTNSNPAINEKDYEIRVFRQRSPVLDDPDTFIEITEDMPVHDFFYHTVDGNTYRPSFRLSVTNRSREILCVSPVILGFDYGIDNGIFQPMEISPEHSEWLTIILANTPVNVIRLDIDEIYQSLGYERITEYLKLFISLKACKDTDSLNQDGVVLPAKSLKKGFTAGDAGNPGQAWQAITIGFRTTMELASASIRDGQPAQVGAVGISTPEAFNAKMTLSSSAVLSKSGAAGPARFQNNYLSPADLNGGTRDTEALDVLELHEVNDPLLIRPDTPLKIDMGTLTEPILPLGYDTQTGLYFPLGYSTPGGSVIIEILPEETAAAEFKSFGGSIKIYFQKVIGRKLGLTYAYPRLAIPSVNADGLVTYDADIAAVKTRVAGAARILLFIHGIIGDTEGMAQCAYAAIGEDCETLSEHTDLILTFDYENLNTPIAETAHLLKAALARVGIAEGHGKQLIIIAHSMGGLVSRYLIEQNIGSALVSRLIMLGTPNNGTPWAAVRDLVAVLLTYGINGAALLHPWLGVLAKFGGVLDGVQVTIKEMNSETGLYAALNSGVDPNVPYAIIAGNTQNIIPKYDETAKLLTRMFSKIKQRGIYDALDTVIFGQPNDIAVTDRSIGAIRGSETWAETLTVHEVDCDHLNYFLNQEAMHLVLGYIK